MAAAYWYSLEEALAWMREAGGEVYAGWTFNETYAVREGSIWKLNHMANGVWDWRRMASK